MIILSLLDNLSAVRYCEQEHLFPCNKYLLKKLCPCHPAFYLLHPRLHAYFCIYSCGADRPFISLIQMSNIRSLHLFGYRSLQVIKSSSVCWPISSNPQKSGNKRTRLLFGEKLLFSRTSVFLTSALYLYVLLCKWFMLANIFGISLSWQHVR